MENIVIFVDFENIQNIKNEHLNNNTDIIIIVGIDQVRKAYDYTKVLLEKVSSVNLIKVNGRGNNALDFFLIFYLGVFFEKMKDKNLYIYLYSNDSGYIPLVTHLKRKGITIEIIGKQKVPIDINKVVSVNKTNENYNIVLNNIDPKTKKGAIRSRPKTLKGLKSSMAIWLKTKKEDNKINIIIDQLMNNNIIMINNKEKINYIHK